MRKSLSREDGGWSWKASLGVLREHLRKGGRRDLPGLRLKGEARMDDSTFVAGFPASCKFASSGQIFAAGVLD